jgi:hypothetical protein
VLATMMNASGMLVSGIINPQGRLWCHCEQWSAHNIGEHADDQSVVRCPMPPKLPNFRHVRVVIVLYESRCLQLHTGYNTVMRLLLLNCKKNNGSLVTMYICISLP